jgi:hypothetical protein
MIGPAPAKVGGVPLWCSRVVGQGGDYEWPGNDRRDWMILNMGERLVVLELVPRR